MEGRSGGAAGVGLVAFLVGSFGSGVGMPTAPELEPRPTIIVVGGGVKEPEGKAAGRLDDSGMALAAGVYDAWSEGGEEARHAAVRIEWVDDHNSPVEAAQIARRIAAERTDVLAVLGYTQSSTAAAALPFLRRAGIPVLLPIATNVELGRDPESGELVGGTGVNGSGVSRFIADDALQACAIESLFVGPEDGTQPRWSRVLLVREGGDVAGDYVDALAYMLERRLGSRIVAQRRVTDDLRELGSLAIDSQAQKVDAVCFLGYPEMARRVIFSLTKEGGGTVPVILPDACVRLLWEKRYEDEPDLYVTFPVDSAKPSGQVGWQAVVEEEGAPGFDAGRLSFVSSARSACKALIQAMDRNGPLSRLALRSRLARDDAAPAYSVVRRSEAGLQIRPVVAAAKLGDLRRETARRAGRKPEVVR